MHQGLRTCPKVRPTKQSPISPRDYEATPARVDGTYRSGPCQVWIKVWNPASIAVQRELEEVNPKYIAFSPNVRIVTLRQ